MCDNFRDNKWKPLPPLDDEDKDTLFKSLNMAVSHTVRNELDAETEDDRKCYLEQETKIKNLITKLFDPKKHTPCWKPQKEKKLRPFKESEEFIEHTGLDVGSRLYYRSIAFKPENLWTRKVVITGLLDNRNDMPSVVLGNVAFDFEYITENFIYSTDGRVWKPFGVYE